jgi:hypothetical protein
MAPRRKTSRRSKPVRTVQSLPDEFIRARDSIYPEIGREVDAEDPSRLTELESGAELGPRYEQSPLGSIPLPPSWELPADENVDAEGYPKRRSIDKELSTERGASSSSDAGRIRAAIPTRRPRSKSKPSRRSSRKKR